jgi:hypothetical protein
MSRLEFRAILFKMAEKWRSSRPLRAERRDPPVVPVPYLEPSFLDTKTCQRIRRAMDAGVADEAEVLDAAIERRDAVRHATSIDR